MDIDETYLTYYSGPKSDHFDGEKFFNPWAPRPKKGFGDMLKWKFNGERAEWPDFVENPGRPAIEENPSAKARVTYIGHATMLVQMNGTNLLVDPVFSERASPFSYVGPKRVRAPFIPLDKLPRIDAVYVSHNHYDHLDLASLSWLAANRKPLIITPLGNTRIIKQCAQDCRMAALDWHQATMLPNGVELTVVPTQHWSRRSMNDINRDLWGGVYLKAQNSPSTSIYYVADSGFHADFFKELAQRYGAPDIAMIPIGAYEPRWFMKYSHMNPEEAVALHQILKATKSMGFHFETFQLTDEAFDAPRKATEALLEKHKIRGQDFLIPYPGDFIDIG